MLVEWNTIARLWPEVILIAAASSIFVGGAFTRSRAWWAAVALLSYAAAAGSLAVVGSPWTNTSELTGPVTIDAMSMGLRWLALAMGVIFTLAASRLADLELASEMLGCLMLVTVGAMLVAAANELVLLFLGLELISIPTYVLLFLGRKGRASAEATMKYFFLSIFSSALLLYGFALVYGIAGTTIIAGNEETRGIREQIAGLAGQPPPLAALAPLALVLLVAGFGFKLAAAPLQFYAPDVYQGTTNLNAGILAVAPKIAGVAGLIRLALVAMPAAGSFGWQLALVLAVLTMTIGNVSALWQSNIRRLLAYSSIAHGGYLLIGLAVAAGSPGAGGIMSLLLYVAVYAAATMGTFAALAYLGSTRREVNGVEELAGLGKSQPLVAGSIALFMFSLAGIPPLAGFWGKLALFGSAIRVAAEPAAGPIAGWFAILAVVGVLNAAIAAAYYLRIVAVMYFQPSAREVHAKGGWGALAAAVLCAAVVVGIGIYPRPVLNSAQAASDTLQSRGPAVANPAPPAGVVKR